MRSDCDGVKRSLNTNIVWLGFFKEKSDTKAIAFAIDLSRRLRSQSTCKVAAAMSAVDKSDVTIEGGDSPGGWGTMV